MTDSVKAEPKQVERKIDYSGLTLNGRELPVVYVDSEFVRKSDNPTFAHIIDELSSQPQPGFFFTPNERGDKFLRVRLGLNRHGILKSDIFRDEQGNIYRDVDAKGIGYVRGYPMRVLPVQESDMGGDMELRGIYHYEFANEDWLITEELAGLGIRVARNVAQIELFELVDIISKELKLIDIVARQAAGHRVGLNMDSVRPVVQIRAMGTTARVIDLPYYERDPSYLGYVKEIVDDAMGLVSLELGQRISPRDYAVWFIETLSSMLGFMHRKDVSPDFRKQIHSGTHNVTLDCRLLDTHAYDTPQGMQRERLRQIETCRTRPELSWLYDKPKLTREEVEANNLEVEREDIRRTLLILKNLVGGVETVYDLGNLKGEIKKRFGAAYGRTYVPIKNRHAPVNS